MIRGNLSAALLGLLLVVFPACGLHAAEPKVTVVAFGLFGDQSVFESEAKGAAGIAASRFGGTSVIVRANTKTRDDASVRTLATTLQTAAARMDAENDVLVLILTSHGSPAGLAVQAGSRNEMLSPVVLAALLARTGVRHRIVIVSACYSGVFIPALANPDTLVITAADAKHPSFGCQDGAQWTYFGDAFFNTALRRTANLKEAFAAARILVRKRERQHGFAASNPQMAGGENIARLLKGQSTASVPAANR